jgi:hypothetical protein
MISFKRFGGRYALCRVFDSASVAGLLRLYRTPAQAAARALADAVRQHGYGSREVKALMAKDAEIVILPGPESGISAPTVFRGQGALKDAVDSEINDSSTAWCGPPDRRARTRGRVGFFLEDNARLDARRARCQGAFPLGLPHLGACTTLFANATVTSGVCRGAGQGDAEGGANGGSVEGWRLPGGHGGGDTAAGRASFLTGDTRFYQIRVDAEGRVDRVLLGQA